MFAKTMIFFIDKTLMDTVIVSISQIVTISDNWEEAQPPAEIGLNWC